MMIQQRGFSDLPLDDNLTAEGLGIANYYRGLARFITQCHTPMTIAIQGDWGTGKTSAMNFVRHELPNDVKTIEFNTWQYAQLRLDEELVFSLMKAVSRPLAADSSKARAYLRSVARISTAVLRSASKVVGAGIGLGDLPGETLDAVEQEFLGEPMGLVERIAQLRGDFQAAVNQYCMETGAKRVVIFIDDLDRLEPRQAVEIMEALKLFFECTSCVFVLAIDFEVVAAGVAEKYGSDMTERKARSFFDKIIQVPFQMPVNAYRVDDLLTQQLKARADLGVGAESIGALVRAASLSIGNNPRSLKRLLNTFDLLHLIADQTRQHEQFDERHSITLFYLLCAQAAFPRFHAALSRAATDDEALMKVLNHEPDSDESSIDAKTYLLEPSEWSALQSFTTEFKSTILGHEDGDDSVPENINIVRDSLRLADVTSTGTSQKTPVTGSTDLLWDQTERREQAVRLFGEQAATRLSTIETLLRQALGEKPLVIGAQQNGTWSLYRASEASDVSALRTRARPKFAEIAAGKKWITLRFGEQSRGSDDLEYKDRWRPLVHYIETEIAHEDSRTARLSFTRTSNPISLSRIESDIDVDFAARILQQVYDLTAQS